MDITFITMHDLTPEAMVLYASDSISDVLGYQPRDVVGKSCFEYFDPEEIPFAKAVHGRGVHLDRAAMLSYCNLKRTDGEYVRCECVFTVVYSVIVACTSLYRHTEKSYGRAEAAPIVRRVFSSSQNDPRYHMLTHLSAKFITPPEVDHEPRAAMILNRFTRTLTIMYATHALGDILGIQAEDAIGRSFFECISEGCLQDAVEALERAKENDSIAYLRFRWRDPRSVPTNNPGRRRRQSTDDAAGSSSGGVPLRDSTPGSETSTLPSDSEDDATPDDDRRGSTPHSSISGNPGGDPDEFVDVEAVVSCTSDGLVVIVRRARGELADVPGVFAAPWARTPVLPQALLQPEVAAPPAVAGGPVASDFLRSIKEVAVFAWSLRSINSDIMQHAKSGPKPDGADKVGDFVKEGSTHLKRIREWEDLLEKEGLGGDEAKGDEDEERDSKRANLGVI